MWARRNMFEHVQVTYFLFDVCNLFQSSQAESLI